MALEDLLGLERDYIYVNESLVENFVQVGKLYIGHWNRVSKHSSYTVKNIMTDRGVNIVQGHTHRMGFYTIRYMDRTIYGWENGCLCNINPTYLVSPNWQSGFSIIEPYNRGRNFNFYQLKINGTAKTYHFNYGGKTFTQR